MFASQLPVGSSQRAVDRSFPWALAASILLKAAALAWLAYFGFPREWGDMVFFKQPAYMALHTGAFSLPTAIGYRPFVEITYAAYPPLYTYASLLMFRLFGFNVYASLAFDLGVHLGFTGLLGWLLWRKIGNQGVAALFVLASTALLLPEGRPDELAALLALLALLLTGRRRYLSAAFLVGLSLATQPTQALLGLILCASLDLASRGLTVRFLARAAALAAGAVLTCALVWLPAVWAHLPEAIAQFRAHSSDRWAPSLAQLFASDPIWAALWVCVVTLVAGYGLLLATRPPAAQRRRVGEIAWLRGLLLALPLGFGLLLVIRSPYYGYRLLNALYLAAAFGLAYTLYSATRTARDVVPVVNRPYTPDLEPAHRTGAAFWGRQSPLAGFETLAGLVVGARTRRQSLTQRCGRLLSGQMGPPLAAAPLALIILLATAMNYNLVRFMLAPLTWDRSTVTYAQAVATVQAVVPAAATVGGDSVAWWTITDGRPFYSLSWYQGEPWPDYLLSTTFWGKGGQPAVLQRRAWAERIAAEYREITPPEMVAGACTLQIFGRAVPLSRSRASCDWHVRIWKRR